MVLFHLILIIAIFCERQKPFFPPLFWSISQRRLEHNGELNTIGFFFIWKTFIYFPTFISFGEGFSILFFQFIDERLVRLYFSTEIIGQIKRLFMICAKCSLLKSYAQEMIKPTFNLVEIKSENSVRERWFNQFTIWLRLTVKILCEGDKGELKDDEIRSRCGFNSFPHSFHFDDTAQREKLWRHLKKLVR